MAKKNFIKRVVSDTLQKFGYVEKNFKAISLDTLGNRGFLGRTPESIAMNGLKKPNGLSFQTIRMLARHDAVIRICVNVIKKAVSQADWNIVVKKNAPNDHKFYDKEISRAYELFEYLNTNNETLRLLLDRVLEDLLVLDAGAIEIVRNLKGDVIGLNSVDAATLRPVYDEYGNLGDPAYYQYVEDKKVAEFQKEDLVYMMANPQNDLKLFGYGMSPIESILLQVQASLEADMYNIKHFSKDNVPPGILHLGDINGDAAEEFIALWNATVIGNTHSLKFMWGSEGSKYIPFNVSNKDMQYSEYIEWLSRVKLAAYGLSGLDANIMQDSNRATAMIQKEISNSRWVSSARRLVEEYFTRQIIWQMGEQFKWLQFKFDDIDSSAEKKTIAEVDKLYIEAGVFSADEIREKRFGLAPIPKKPVDPA